MRIATLLLLICATPALAAPSGEWPCVQRKVPELSAATFWPSDIAPLADRWQTEIGGAPAVAAMVSRRTPVTEIPALAKSYADAATPEARAERLNLAFAGSFAQLNRLRSEIVNGIERYTKAQRAVAERLNTDRQRLDTLMAADRTPEQQREAEALQNGIQWQTRVHKEREGSLVYICEVPVLLEQRIYAISQALSAQLP